MKIPPGNQESHWEQKTQRTRPALVNHSEARDQTIFAFKKSSGKLLSE